MTSFTEKYRPKTLDDCILPDRIKKTLKSFVKKNELPNCLFVGSAGLGKTSAAQSIINDMNLDVLKVNGSLSGNIDTLRNEILQYSSTNSFSGKRKCVLLDEADYLNPNSTQPALRNFMEEYAKNVTFILTCNYANKIIDPLKSRCAVINFNLSPKEKAEVLPSMYQKLVGILDKENIEYEDKILGDIVKKYIGDWRKLINEIQKYSATGKLDVGVYLSDFDPSIDKIIEILKSGNFRNMIDWVNENYDVDFTEFCGKLYKQSLANKIVAKNSIPEMVLLINRYQFEAAFILDKQIHMAAFCTDIMKSMEFN